jgi:CRISPR/Cas system-associated exonuclease Cas4 (RecB family)
MASVEECPRRWWLEHAQYAAIEGSYPLPNSSAAIRGTVVHRTLEEFARQLHDAGLPAPGTEAFIAVRRSFEVRKFVRQFRDEELNNQSARGRHLGPSDVPTEDCIDAFRLLVSRAYARDDVSTTTEPPHRETSLQVTREPAEKPSLPVSGDVVPEVELQLEEPPLTVKIDLVKYGDEGDTLIDFKSGSPKDRHRFQSDMYAAVWVTVTGRNVSRRQILYWDESVVDLEGMDRATASETLQAIRKRIDDCVRDLHSAPPPARPQVDNCRHCPVRHLCEVYWMAPETAELRSGSTTPFGEWRDLELNVSHALWEDEGFSVSPGPNRTTILYCRLPSRYRPEPSRYRAVKLLGVSLRRVGAAAEVVWSASSEAFWQKEHTD